MQGVDAIDDLLQRPIRDDAREDDIAAAKRGRDAARSEAADDAFPRRDPRDDAAGAQRADELIGMPALPRGEDRYYGVSTPVSTVNPPVANLGKSSLTLFHPGVAVPFLSASMDANVNSAFR